MGPDTYETKLFINNEVCSIFKIVLGDTES